MPQVPTGMSALFVAECTMNEMGSDAFKKICFKNQKERILKIPHPSISEAEDLLVVYFGFIVTC